MAARRPSVGEQSDLAGRSVESGQSGSNCSAPRRRWCSCCFVARLGRWFKPYQRTS